MPPALFSANADPRSTRRVEDRRFLTGAGRYVDDGVGAGALVAAFVRSPHAHAVVVSVDAAAARAVPGVRAVFTGADLAGLGPLPCFMDLKVPLVVPPRYALARNRVRHQGEAVALVIAETAHAAQDGVEAVAVEYDVLPAAVDAVEGGPAIWDEAPGNVAFRFRRGDAEAVAGVLAGAAHVVELELVNNRIAAVALEPRTVVASFADARWLLELSGASVHVIRRELAAVLGVGEDALDVTCPDVGGGFGMKNVTYPEYAALLFAARAVGAPVRWVASRLEEFSTGVHGRANRTRARLGLDADGGFVGLAVETVSDLGAYVSTGGPGSSTIAPATAMGGLYAVPAISMAVTGVFTNTVPIDAYRGAGKPEANYIIERLIDVAARRLGMDRVALRRRNLIAAFPHVTAMGLTIDCGDFVGNLDRALAAADHAGFAGRRTAAAARGRLRGLGVAYFLETSRGPVNEEGWVRFPAGGGIDVAVGTQSNGQGHETSFVELVAGRLGVDRARVRFVQGDTREVPRGGGHGGARSLHMGGTALVMAADDVLRKAAPLAAGMLQASDVAFVDGAFRAGAGAVTVAEVAAAFPGAIDGHGDNKCDVFTFPNGCHVAEVEVDAETGSVTLVRYVAVDDYGILLNPLLTEGQVQGGIVQGIGQALCEGVAYDGDGQLVSATFMDYAIPLAEGVPWVEVGMVELATAANPLGSKGSGQAGAIGAPQTVMNAVMDALGVEHLDMPATAGRVWGALRQSGVVRAR